MSPWNPAIVVVITSGVLGVTAWACSTSHPTVATPPEYEVYAALIRAVYVGAPPTPTDWAGGSRPAHRVVIRDHTFLDVDLQHASEEERIKQREYIHAQLHCAAPELVDTLFDSNRVTTALQNRFPLVPSVTFMSDRDFDRIFDHDPGEGWTRFYEEYPQAPGILTLSRVAFNSSATRAVVYAQNTSGPLEGVGYYLCVRWDQGRWVIEDKVVAWES